MRYWYQVWAVLTFLFLGNVLEAAETSAPAPGPNEDSLWNHASTLPLLDFSQTAQELLNQQKNLAYPLKPEVAGSNLEFFPFTNLIGLSSDDPVIKSAERSVIELLKMVRFIDANFTIAHFQQFKHVFTFNEMVIYKLLTSLAYENNAAPKVKLPATFFDQKGKVRTAKLQETLQSFLYRSRQNAEPFYLQADQHQAWITLIKYQLSMAQKFYFDIVESGLGPQGQDHFQGLPDSTWDIPIAFVEKVRENPHWTATMFYRAKRETWNLDFVHQGIQANKKDPSKAYPFMLTDWHSRSQAYAALKYRYLRLAALIDPQARAELDRAYPFWKNAELDENFPFVKRSLDPLSFSTGGKNIIRLYPHFLNELGRLWRTGQSEIADQYIIKSFGPSYPVQIASLTGTLYTCQQLQIFDELIFNEIYDFYIRYAKKNTAEFYHSPIKALPKSYQQFFHKHARFFKNLEKRITQHPFSPDQTALTPEQKKIVTQLNRMLATFAQEFPRQDPPALNKDEASDKGPSLEQIKLIQEIIEENIGREMEPIDAIYTLLKFYPLIGQFIFDVSYHQRQGALAHQTATSLYSFREIDIPPITHDGRPNALIFQDFDHLTTRDGWHIALGQRISRPSLAAMAKLPPSTKDFTFPFVVEMDGERKILSPYYDGVIVTAKTDDGQPNEITFLNARSFTTAEGRRFSFDHDIPLVKLQKLLNLGKKSIKFPATAKINSNQRFVIPLEHHPYDLSNKITFPVAIQYPTYIDDPRPHLSLLGPWAKIDFRYLTLEQRDAFAAFVRKATLEQKILFCNIIEDLMTELFPHGFSQYKQFLDPQIANFIDEFKNEEGKSLNYDAITLSIQEKINFLQKQVDAETAILQQQQKAAAEAAAREAAREAARQAELRRQQEAAALAEEMSKVQWQQKPPAEKLAFHLQRRPDLWPVVFSLITGEELPQGDNAGDNDPTRNEVITLSKTIGLVESYAKFQEQIAPENIPAETSLLTFDSMQKILVAAIKALGQENLMASNKFGPSYEIFKFLCLQRFLLQYDNATFEEFLAKDLPLDREHQVIKNFWDEFILGLASSQEYDSLQPTGFDDKRYEKAFTTLGYINLMMGARPPFKRIDPPKLYPTYAFFFEKMFWDQEVSTGHGQILLAALTAKNNALTATSFQIKAPGLEQKPVASDLVKRLRASQVFQELIKSMTDPFKKHLFNPFENTAIPLAFVDQAPPNQAGVRAFRHLGATINDQAAQLKDLKVVFYIDNSPQHAQPVVYLTQVDKYQGTAKNERVVVIEQRHLDAIFGRQGSLSEEELENGLVKWMWHYLTFGKNYVDQQYNPKYLQAYSNFEPRYAVSRAWRLFYRFDDLAADKIMIAYHFGRHNTGSYDAYNKKHVPSVVSACAGQLVNPTAEKEWLHFKKKSIFTLSR